MKAKPQFPSRNLHNNKAKIKLACQKGQAIESVLSKVYNKFVFKITGEEGLHLLSEKGVSISRRVSIPTACETMVVNWFFSPLKLVSIYAKNQPLLRRIDVNQF